MHTIKTLLAAGTMAAAMLAGAAGANAAPVDHNRIMVRHEMRQDARFDHRVERRVEHRFVARERINDTLRFHRYRAVAAPHFVRGHYVVKTFNRFGRVVFVEINPRTGAFLGEVRI